MDNQQLSRTAHDTVASEAACLDDWKSFRSLGHRIIDDLADFLSSVSDRPITVPLAPEDVQRWMQPVPLQGQRPDIVYDLVRADLFPRPLGNLHPQYWGWADGSGVPLAALANLLASALNPNVEGIDHAACLVELQVVQWWATLFAFPAQASGLLVSGTSTANLLAIAIARNTAARKTSNATPATTDLVFYASAEVHCSVTRAVSLLLGRPDALHTVGTRDDGAMDPTLLRGAITRDRQAGRIPACIIATLGTTTTGAVDDLQAIRAIAREHDLWLHVDGAYGALAHLAPSGRQIVAGIENADSLAFDLHKWPYLPFGTGCLLTSHPDDHLRTFAMEANYLTGFPVPPSIDGIPPFSRLGIEVSREFRALRVWICMQVYGISTFAELIDRNLAQARRLRELIGADSELELVAPTTLNIVCFRWIGSANDDDERLNAVNQKILARLLLRPRVVVSGSTFNGKFVLRAAIFNHRSTDEDFDRLIDVIREEAAAVTVAG